MSECLDRFDEIDKMLFEASNLILRAHIQAADRKIADARIRLDKLRSRHE